jgi:hypothetical protein
MVGEGVFDEADDADGGGDDGRDDDNAAIRSI